MRKLTLLTLLAAILCLPQMVMAEKYNPTFYFDSYNSTLGTLVVGESYDASQDLQNLSGVTPVTWSTSDPTIVSVDENGIITVHKTGSVTLYAHSDESTYFYAADAQKELNITTYPLSVLKEGGWVDVTPSTASNIDGEGKVSYDYSTHTLTLNNWANDFTSITDFSTYTGGAIVYILQNQPLTIRLIGTNTITCGEFCSANTLIFSGADAAQDKLIVNSTNSYSISATNLTIDNASLILNENVTTLYQYQNFIDRGVFYADKLSVVNGGNLHATVTGNESADVCPACLAVGVVSSALVGDITTSNVIWTADAANETRINNSFRSNTYDGFFFFANQSEDELPREVEISSNAPATSTSVIWEASEINFIINWDHGYAGNHSNTLDDITITADGGNDDFSQFGNVYSDVRSLSVQNNATLTFSSSLGDFKSIVISYNPLYMVELANLGAGWTVNNHQLTWTGDASSVVLATNGNSSSNIYLEQITSVVFYFDTPPASVPTTTIKWEGSDLTDINLYESASEAVNTIKVATKAPLSGDYSHFMTYDGNTSFSINNGGTVTFYPTSGQLTSIVIETNSTQHGLDYLETGFGWDYNDHKLVWSGSASSVTLAVNGASGSVSCQDIQSIEFTVADVPVANSTITWGERQVSHVSLYAGEVGNTQKAPLIKNIFVSLTRESEGSGTSCRFAEKYLAIDNCGKLKFQSVAGDIQGIVINGSSNTYADNLSADWTYDDGAKTLTWDGTASDEVTLSGNIYGDISSIEFTYTPASAPRLGEIINGFYEITGAHTAKVFTAAGSIPDYIEDDEVTYYITEISDYAYYNDPTEGYFYFGANIAKVGAHAFEGCSRAIEFTFYSTVLDEIGDEAFKNCKLLGWLNFDTKMPPVLGSNAFSGDGFLNHINVYPEISVWNAYKAAAGWSTYADKITLSSSFPATIGDQFFFKNQKTTNIYAVSSVDQKEIKVMPYTAEVNALYPITRTGTLVIPEEAGYLNTGCSVTGIGANAYKDSARFDVVMIPQAVKSIEAGAFLNCTGVENVFFLWNDPTSVTWYDGDKGLEFKTANNGGTKIFVPEGKLDAYQAWAPAWAGCMYEGEIEEVDATAGQDPDKTTRYYRTYFDSSHDLMMPPSVWAHVGYVRNNEFILRPIAFDGEIVPAGTAVVLESETPIYSLIKMDPAVPSYTGTNDLIGSDVAFPRTDLGENADKVYVLGKSATIGTDHLVGMGLYRYVGETLGAHKAYMVLENVPPVPESGQQNAPIRFLFRHENTATGIENASANFGGSEKRLENGQLIIIKNGVRYNAQGQIVK